MSLAEHIAKVYEDGPPAPGMILDIRNSVLAMKHPGIDDADQLHRKLIAVVETDRCLPGSKT